MKNRRWKTPEELGHVEKSVLLWGGTSTECNKWDRQGGISQRQGETELHKLNQFMSMM